MSEELRKTEVLEGGKWKTLSFYDIKAGNIFRLFDGDAPVVGKGDILMGTTEWKAASDAYLRNNVWTVDCELTEADLQKYANSRNMEN